MDNWPETYNAPRDELPSEYYCSECGAQMRPERTGKFHPHTGKELYRMVCPEKPCEHGRHLDRRYKGWFWDFECIRCGRKGSYD